MGGKKVGSFSSPFLPSSASYRFFFSSVRWSCASYRCSYFCFRMKQGISSTVWPVGCLHLFCLKKHQHNTNKKKPNPKPQTQHCPTKMTITKSSPFQQFQLFCCLCLTFLHPQKSSKGQETRGCMGVLVTGATGPLQSGQAHITGNILPLSHHQHSHDYLITGYSVITSLPPGHKTARPAVSGRNCSMPNLNLTVLLFKITPWAHAISGQNKACRA